MTFRLILDPNEETPVQKVPQERIEGLDGDLFGVHGAPFVEPISGSSQCHPPPLSITVV